MMPEVSFLAELSLKQRGCIQEMTQTYRHKSSFKIADEILMTPCTMALDLTL